MRDLFLKISTSVMLTAIMAGVDAAPLTIFSDKTAFLAATGATSASGSLPDIGFIADGSETVGSITFNQAGSHSLFIGTTGTGVGDWTTSLPGNEIAINDTEDLNLSTATPVFALGFEFAEPSLGGSGTGSCFVANCIDSTFTVTLKAGISTVGSFQFNVQDDIAGFVGVWSDVAFNGIEVRETSGGIDDEFYGHVFSGSVAPVPVPAALPLLVSALGMFGVLRRRQS